MSRYKKIQTANEMSVQDLVDFAQGYTSDEILERMRINTEV